MGSLLSFQWVWGKKPQGKNFKNSQNHVFKQVREIMPGKHATRDCTKQAAKMAKCINCGEDHPQSTRGNVLKTNSLGPQVVTDGTKL